MRFLGPALALICLCLPGVAPGGGNDGTLPLKNRYYNPVEIPADAPEIQLQAVEGDGFISACGTGRGRLVRTTGKVLVDGVTYDADEACVDGDEGDGDLTIFISHRSGAYKAVRGAYDMSYPDTVTIDELVGKSRRNSKRVHVNLRGSSRRR